MRRVRRPLLALIALVVALGIGYAFKAADTSSSRGSIRTVAMSSLPSQVATTVHLIEDGGPFAFQGTDGAVFANEARRLPREPAGYYREYTVPTPGLSDRGTRRIVRGRGGTFYYSSDGDESFVRLDVTR